MDTEIETIRLHLTSREAWLLDSIFKGRGLFQFPSLLHVMQIIAEAIVEGEAEGEIDENSLWLMIDLTPAGLMLGDTRGVALLEKLYELAVRFYRGEPIPNAFKNAFKEVKDDDKDRTETRCEYPSEDFTIS